MNVSKAAVARMNDRKSVAVVGPNGRDADADRESVLDLLFVLEDERRSHAAAAVLSEDPAECERYRALAHESTALLANIRQGMAHVAQQQLSGGKRSRQLERYVERLIDGSQRSDGRHAPRNAPGDSP